MEEGDGLVSVEAGPGSGKTRVIVARLLHLLQRRGVYASTAGSNPRLADPRIEEP